MKRAGSLEVNKLFAVKHTNPWRRKLVIREEKTWELFLRLEMPRLVGYFGCLKIKKRAVRSQDTDVLGNLVT